MDKSKSDNRVEGEGSYTATRAYNKHLGETMKSGHVGEKAKEARKAVDGPEGAELRRAEAEGKRHARPEDK